MIKRILKPFRSMSVIAFLLDICIFTFAAVIIVLAAVSISRTDTVTRRKEAAEEYLGELAEKLVLNAYLANSQENEAISRDMSLMADSFEGRILIIDSNLNCIYDSYNVVSGKSFISAEVIRALNGVKGENSNLEAKRIELFYPVKNYAESNSDLSGVIIFSFSIAQEYDMSDRFGKSLLLIVIPCAVLVFILAIFHSKHITKPLKSMTRSLNHISEGYFDERIETKDIKEFEEMSEAVNNMLTKLSSMEDSRQEFVSNVSHELKTPITSIKILADSLIQQPDAPPEVYQEFLGDINAEIDRENRIITDLLELVKLDRKKGEMHIAMVSINELLEILMKRIKPIAQKHNVDMIYESYRKVEAEVDEVKLTLAISNLVENAVKYNKDGGWVKVTLDSDHRYFVVSVSDSGIGIPEESLGLIFDRFYRVDKMRARKTGGTGLGLSITRSVVLMHNGQLRVESKEGEGTTFTVRIPMSFVENRTEDKELDQGDDES